MINCEFYQRSFVSNSFGKGAAQIRIRIDFTPDPDPAKSFGSDRIRIRLWIRIHNTAKGGMETNLFKASNNEREKRVEMGGQAVISAYCGCREVGRDNV